MSDEIVLKCQIGTSSSLLWVSKVELLRIEKFLYQNKLDCSLCLKFSFFK
jgi:hypothetical protein